MLLKETSLSAGVENLFVSLIIMESILISSSKQKGETSTKNLAIKSSMKLLKKSFKKLARKGLVYLFAFYKVALRPTFGNACKFTPSCSDYSYKAYQKHGFFKGSCLTIYRLLRCHPFSKGGMDPVPGCEEVYYG